MLYMLAAKSVSVLDSVCEKKQQKRKTLWFACAFIVPNAISLAFLFASTIHVMLTKNGLSPPCQLLANVFVCARYQSRCYCFCILSFFCILCSVMPSLAVYTCDGFTRNLPDFCIPPFIFIVGSRMRRVFTWQCVLFCSLVRLALVRRRGIFFPAVSTIFYRKMLKCLAGDVGMISLPGCC